MDEIRVLLAECQGLGRIDLCECKSIHMTVGPVSVNLAPEAFALMATMVRGAMEELARVVGLPDDEGNDKNLTGNGLSGHRANPLSSLGSVRSRVTH